MGTNDHQNEPAQRVCIVHVPIIVGGGPSGLAVAATLRLLSVPALVLERSDGIADLWRNRTYDRLHLHLPKDFCQLPHLPFPDYFPTYPTRDQFLHYLHSYVESFSLQPLFDCTVTSARFDPAASLWRVTAVHRHSPDAAAQSNSLTSSSDSESNCSLSSSELSASATEPTDSEVVEYVSPWLVVATGENGEPVVPEIKGMEVFSGRTMHSSEYKSGAEFKGMRVLVVGCGNSGMETCVDLCEHGAMPFMSVRNGVHVLPREMLGNSTFGVAMKLLKWLPIKLVDRFLIIMAKLIIGDTDKYGLKRPKMGPLELKQATGKTPVLDVGALSLIKSGRIKIVPEVESLTSDGAKFVDGKEMAFDSVVFATGYRSSVPFWLKESTFFSVEGKPRTPFPNSWKGDNGLYCVGFTGKGLLGAGIDAVKAAADISESWKSLLKRLQAP